MIGKLRKKIIFLAMISLVVLMAVMLVGMNLLTFRSVMREADDILGLLSQNEGEFPDPEFWFLPPQRGFSKETPYESRYFWVYIDLLSRSVITDTGSIASVDRDKAVELAADVVKTGKTSGFTESFRFAVSENPEGIRITFLDCSKSLNEERRFFVNSLIIAVIGLLTAFFFISLFSKKLVRPVAESYEKQKRFITDAGHEIKTPLAIISANADLLSADPTDEECVNDIKTQTKRLASLTNDLIFLAKMEEGSSVKSFEDFSLSSTVFSTAEAFRGPLQAKNCEYAIDIRQDIVMNGDRKAVSQLVTVLLDNAVKYTGENGRVSVELKKQNRAALFTVINTVEKPVDREKLSRVFDRFYRADESRSSDTEGYGIGLSTAQAIVSAHKGKIAASTDTGNEFIINVILPL